MLDPRPANPSAVALFPFATLAFGWKHRSGPEAGPLRLLNARTAHRRASYHMIRFKNWIETLAFPNVRR